MGKFNDFDDVSCQGMKKTWALALTGVTYGNTGLLKRVGHDELGHGASQVSG